MAFYDDLARDPKTEAEFWTIIEETFIQVNGVLTDYPVETPEEALNGTLRKGKFRDTAAAFALAQLVTLANASQRQKRRRRVTSRDLPRRDRASIRLSSAKGTPRIRAVRR
jgi:hypothetical protein